MTFRVNFRLRNTGKISFNNTENTISVVLRLSFAMYFKHRVSLSEGIFPVFRSRKLTQKVIEIFFLYL